MHKASPEEYRLLTFLSNNYYRKICKSCNTPFWTKNREREICSDVPCTDYYFFDLNINSRPLTLREVRKVFLTFFEKKGHTIIPPKPVLARWREDLYLTIASIVDFQPHVTSGLTKPPANPLVLSQPCIRLEDVDNVGITFGRHLTTFEMAAHHAFNYQDKYIYWKDETIELSKEFFVNEIGIPEDELNYKESWWEGGGNAGPSFEVTVGGLELATLVFMQYKIDNGNYVPLKLKIVDTGYGLERIAWFTQKTPTAFHAIYGDLVDKFFDKIGVNKVDEKLLRTAARFAGRIDPENLESIKLHKKMVAEALGLSYSYVDEELTRAARVFQILDHTKTIALMLADGLVPSNSGEGYLGRLLIRRTLRVLKILGSDIKLSELIKDQITYWGEDFPQLIKNKDYILEVVDLEQERFNELLSKVPTIISSYSRKGITINDLIEIYDSNGIPPDIIAEEFKKRGVNIEIPHNFYSLVAKRHQSAPIKPVKKLNLPEELIDEIKNLQPTRKLYYEDTYSRDFEATVILVKDNYLILDRTCFYPEGGGQLGDTGIIISSSGKQYKVKDTQKIDEVIVHILDEKPDLTIGERVRGIIDWQRRYRLMRHHTATHVVLAAARKVLGNHVWQAGAEKTPNKARLDITHYKLLTDEEVKKIEELANFVINDMRPVTTILMDRVEAEMKYGISIYEGGVPDTAELRLLEIKDWDIEACGGTHVHNTSEIGGIKIINVEKIQDGVIRLEYVAGDMITYYSRSLENTLNTISSLLVTSKSQILDRISKIMENIKYYQELLNKYRRLYIDNMINKNYELINDIRLYLIRDIFDEEVLKEFMRRMTNENLKTIVISFQKIENKVKIDLASSKDLSINNIVNYLKSLGGKGGGKDTYATIVIDNENIENLISRIKERIYRGL
jgi:alanyl-tRNA synthetase